MPAGAGVIACHIETHGYYRGCVGEKILQQCAQLKPCRPDQDEYDEQSEADPDVDFAEAPDAAGNTGNRGKNPQAGNHNEKANLVFQAESQTCQGFDTGIHDADGETDGCCHAKNSAQQGDHVDAGACRPGDGFFTQQRHQCSAESQWAVIAIGPDRNGESTNDIHAPAVQPPVENCHNHRRHTGINSVGLGAGQGQVGIAAKVGDRFRCAPVKQARPQAGAEQHGKPGQA